MLDVTALPTEIADALRDLDAHYAFSEVGNRGANGHLFFGHNRVTHAHVAVKFYYGEPGTSQHDEPRSLHALSAPNVLEVLDARDVGEGWAYFITPRCTGGDLDDLIATAPSAHTAINVALGITAGVATLHSRRIVHRDLKPANIVMDTFTPKIADFGSIRTLAAGEDAVTASKHSVLYRPPESFDSNRYSIKGDIYQVGLVVYQLLGGRLSYNGLDYCNSKERTAHAQITDSCDASLFLQSVIARKAAAGSLADMSSLPGWINASIKMAIRRMLHPDPAKRLSTMADVAAELTRMRTAVLDWRWRGDIATLTSNGLVIELRPCGDSLYEAYQDHGCWRSLRIAGIWTELGAARGPLPGIRTPCAAPSAHAQLRGGGSCRR